MKDTLSTDTGSILVSDYTPEAMNPLLSKKCETYFVIIASKYFLPVTTTTNKSNTTITINNNNNNNNNTVLLNESLISLATVFNKV